MDYWLQIRLAILFAVGALVGGQVNRGIYRLAWFARCIGPWSAPHADAPPRGVWDRLPIVGWWGLRREAPIHGRGYWIRPLLIETACASGFAWLYWWEMQNRLVPIWAPAAIPVADIQYQYLSHAILISLMAVATFIDFDEKTIPDAITIPGVLIALILAAMVPQSHLPVVSGIVIENLHVTSPIPWPPRLDSARWLAVGLVLYLGWCLAVAPATWTLRRGVCKAVQYWFASIVRRGALWRIGILLLLGLLIIVPAWLAGGTRWQAVFSSLVGMAFAGGLVWAVRIIGGNTLGKEAMGFGDVTLMAMIGAFLGWQPSLYIFFLAPFLCILIAVVQWIITRRPDIAFGPYLCGAAVCLIVFWARIWTWLAPVFALGWAIPGTLVVCLALMAAMLLGLQAVRRLLFREE